MRQNIFITALLVSISLVVVAHAATLRTVAFTGQPAPGTQSGITYESFGSYVVENFVLHGVVLNDAGQTAFRANLAGSGVDFSNNQGVWSEGPGSLALVARTGSQAPGAPSGVNFSTDPNLELFSPVLNNAGRTAFYGSTTDGGLGFWSEGSGSLAPVARSGEHAPGTSSGVNFTFANLYDYLETPVLNDAGQTSFRAYVAGPGVISGSQQGLWSEGSGSVQLVVRAGSPAPGLPGVNHGSSFEAGLNDAGQTTFFSFLSGSGVNSSNNSSLWSEGSGSLALVARTGNQAPGMPSGVKFDGLSNNGAINSAGQVAFIAGLSNDNSQYNLQESLWSEESGNVTLLALRGTQAPGTASGVVYDAFFGWPELNDAGQIFFGALLTGNGVDASNQVAGFLSDSLGNMTMVFRIGEQAPGTPAGTLFLQGGFPVLNNAGQVAFAHSLAGPSVNSTNDVGIWATDRSGALQLIAREGDDLEVAPGDFRTVSELSFTGGNANSNGWPSAFNNVGQVAYWASFTDDSQGVFVSNKVATAPGDFNFDGTVDAADYVTWRNGLGTLYTQSHYDIWRANFGASLGPGSGSALPSADPLSAAVPEPATLLLMILAAVGWCLRQRRSA